MLTIANTDNACPDESEVECIARQLTTNGFKGFGNEVRALWRGYQYNLNLLREWDYDRNHHASIHSDTFATRVREAISRGSK